MIAPEPQQILDLLAELPEVEAWPEVKKLFVPRDEELRTDWRLPALACQAVGGKPADALAAVAAIACLQISIILVDDLLDQDPRGEYHRLGYGPTANIALAFQAAGLAVIDRSSAPVDRRAHAAVSLARAALGTAYGQDLDVQNLRGEANYWRVVRAKSTPFYGAALQVGALLGGAPDETAQGLYQVGVLLGEMIQIFDDLLDAFAVPANPDWREGRNNLALLYTATAEHPQREAFCRALGHIDSEEQLRSAQQMLIRSGAVSYCVYLLLGRHRSAIEKLNALHLADPNPLQDVLALQVLPLVRWLESLGVPVPATLREEAP